MYAILDCNNFYANCERVFNPLLIGRPVIVWSNNDGCVIALSDEVKALGIKRGDPAFKIKHLIEKYNIAVFSANFPLYGDMSRRVMNIIHQYFCPDVEVYSIDECFMDLSGFNVDLKEYCLKMRSQIRRWTGIPTCVGIAPTKALAKLANRVAKKFPQLGGVHIIDSDEKRIKALKWLEIGDIWGVGKEYKKKLLPLGIKSAFDFTQLPESLVRSMMTVVGLRLQKDLQGIPTIGMEIPEKKQSISTTRSFDRDYSAFDDLRERISTFTSLSAAKLRSQQSLCRKMIVFIETNRFKNLEEKYSNSILLKFPFPTSSTLELVNFAIRGLKTIYLPEKNYKRAGITLMDFVDENEYQSNLFYHSDPKHKKLMATIDKLNNKFGKNLVRIATQDKLTEKMRQEHLSKAYSTDINELIEIKL
ncbi:Y-family DNA polymerase [Petrimonas sp.]|uniref:Y-family DNA polymerase n=1 Tax=Petrimonas sp. TaxID=2023866 RepID=UPI003F517CB8